MVQPREAAAEVAPSKKEDRASQESKRPRKKIELALWTDWDPRQGTARCRILALLPRTIGMDTCTYTYVERWPKVHPHEESYG